MLYQCMKWIVDSAATCHGALTKTKVSLNYCVRGACVSHLLVTHEVMWPLARPKKI